MSIRQHIPTPRAVYVDVVEIDVRAGIELLEAAGFSVGVRVATTPANVVAAARGAHALLVGDSPVTREVFAEVGDLGIVASCTVGIDHIDADAAREHGVWVSNVPDAATEEVAAHALALALALLRHLPGWDRHVRAGGWDYRAEGPLRRPSSLTLGIVGLGRIGRQLVRLAHPLFGAIVATDPGVPDERWPDDVARVSPDELFARSDVVSLHLPLTADTYGIVDRDRLRSMPRGGFLVNVSRAQLVDGEALLEALDDGQLAGAGIDVFSPEPPSPSDPLLRHPNVLLSPHVAYLSDEADRAYVVKQATNVVSWYRDGAPLDAVVEGARR